MNNSNDYVSSTHRVFKLLTYLTSNPNASATKLAGAVGVSRSSVYRMLGIAHEAFGVRIARDENRFRVVSMGTLKADIIDVMLKQGIYTPQTV
jgi:DNA-binding MarR family transcriptional regulator